MLKLAAPSVVHSDGGGRHDNEVAALKLGDISGGAQGLIVKSPDGKTYSLTIRPLLPDESE